MSRKEILTMTLLLCNGYGASIFVSAVSLPQPFQRLHHNHHCFLLLEANHELPPSLWGQVRKRM